MPRRTAHSVDCPRAGGPFPATNRIDGASSESGVPVATGTSRGPAREIGVLKAGGAADGAVLRLVVGVEAVVLANGRALRLVRDSAAGPQAVRNEGRESSDPPVQCAAAAASGHSACVADSCPLVPGDAQETIRDGTGIDGRESESGSVEREKPATSCGLFFGISIAPTRGGRGDARPQKPEPSLMDTLLLEGEGLSITKTTRRLSSAPGSSFSAPGTTRRVSP